MLRLSSVTFLLAGLAAACGGSKSSKATTTPTAANQGGQVEVSQPQAPTAEPQQPEANPMAQQPTAPSETTPGTQQPSGTPSGTGTEAERQNVSGTTTPESGATAPSTPSGTGSPSSTPAGGFGEPNVIAMLDAANDHEIAVAKLALDKSKNADVKKFAKMMVTDHGQMKNSVDQLASNLSITAQPNEDVETLKTESSAALDRLNGLSGKEFDRAFAEQMVKDHQKVLSLIDDKIKPAVSSNIEIMNALDRDRPKIEKHLDQAKALQAKVNR